VADFVETASAAPSLVVAAAGVTRDAPLLRTSETDWDEVIAVNLAGVAWLLRAAARRWRKTGGHAILVGSYAGVTGRVGGAAYSASKAALSGLARSVARELGARGVRVNVVIPPFVEAGMGAGARGAFVEEMRRRSVLGRPGSAADFARFVAALADTEGVTGQVLHADGRIPS
jgi:3-oxoacyl-[acyl-carrier protein] reductase